MTAIDHILEIDLTGTERQVVWGQSVRLQQIEKLGKMGERNVLRAVRDLLTDEVLVRMKVTTPERLGQLGAMVVFQACANPEARFWIDTRAEDPTTWLLPAAEEVIETNPFQHE